MYKRKIEQTLLDWKLKKNHLPLVVKGAHPSDLYSIILVEIVTKMNADSTVSPHRAS